MTPQKLSNTYIHGRVRLLKRLGVSITFLIVMSVWIATNVASQEGVHISDEYLNSHELDPIVVALGATTSATANTIYRLHSAAEDELASTAESHLSSSHNLITSAELAENKTDNTRTATLTKAKNVVTTRRALESAVETLYAELSKTPQAQEIARQWQKCMARLGFTYSDPTQIEEDLMHLQSGRQNGAIDEILTARDRCLKAVDSATDQLVLQQIPNWTQQNSTQLSAYRDALDVYAKK